MKFMLLTRYIRLLSCIVLFICSIHVIASEPTIEWAPFVKIPEVTEQTLINAADVVNRRFLSKQQGFIKRELIRKNSNKYADVIYWKSESEAVSAGNKINTCSECKMYFELMEVGSKSGGEFSHYTIIKSWSR